MRARRIKLTGPPWLELAAVVLRGAPPLPRALCRGRVTTFDGRSAADIDTAMTLCRRCCELQACREWVAHPAA